jgi:hypothetical protein
MRERSEARGPAIVDVLVRYREQRDRTCVLDEPKREKKVAKLAAGERREFDRIDQRFALESFVTWAKRRRADVEREAPFLDRLAERDRSASPSVPSTTSAKPSDRRSMRHARPNEHGRCGTIPNNSSQKSSSAARQATKTSSRRRRAAARGCADELR